ncbi:hypothetical protein [Serratia entomophila]|uniref:hypothetical protein n=1 Tax=Serratia entomophila TaxID=42906 RepID=UPI0021B72323|nr:hypothetical protein [Serratia entomophila]
MAQIKSRNSAPKNSWMKYLKIGSRSHLTLPVRVLFVVPMEISLRKNDEIAKERNGIFNTSYTSHNTRIKLYLSVKLM